METMVLCIAMLTALMTNTAPPTIDFAESKYVDSWLHHPVYGDPSFDAFARLPGNPIYRGNDEYAWPVNGFLFVDPQSSNWYVYVGNYKAGYANKSHCVLLRSTNQGKSWENLGPIIRSDPKMFDKDGHVPDASVVYDQGRYHMVYDWGEPDFNKEGGLAYAWADKPEGPWHRALEPITRNTQLKKMEGRYGRTYGGTLIKRKDDWLIIGLMDNPPNSWVLFTMTAKKPEGPYSAPSIVRQVERDYYQPPIAEGYPAFVHDGYVYAYQTSVAMNRNYQLLCRAPIEKANQPSAWSIVRDGSVWHSEPVENEYAGIWGQTLTSAILSDGRQLVMFNSRDAQNRGTVNMAVRSWKEPLLKKGFSMSAHEGPAVSLLNRSYSTFTLKTKLKVKGTIQIRLNHEVVLGPNQPTSDVTHNDLGLDRFDAIEFDEETCSVLSAESAIHRKKELARGRYQGLWEIEVSQSLDGWTMIRANGREIHIKLVTKDSTIGLWLKPHTYMKVNEFKITGTSKPAHWNYIYTAALLDSGESMSNWNLKNDPIYRYGMGAVSKKIDTSIKWNFVGSGFRLWSPKGPDWKSVTILLDGKLIGKVDLHSKELSPSKPIFEKHGLKQGPHCLKIVADHTQQVIDSLEVVASKE